MHEIIANYFWILLVPAIYAIFAPRKAEPQWERIGFRVMGVFLLFFTLFGIARNHFTQLELHFVLIELQNCFGSAFIGLAVFNCFSWGEIRKYKRDMAAKNAPIAK